MVQLSGRQKRWIKIGIIVLLALCTVVLVLVSRSQSETNVDVPQQTAITPVAGRFPTIVPPGTDANGNPPPNTILIKDFSFRPPVLRVGARTTVTIFNADSAGHSVSSDEVIFDTGILGANEQGTLTFDTPGTYSYHCRRHPAMSASIVVTP